MLDVMFSYVSLPIPYLYQQLFSKMLSFFTSPSHLHFGMTIIIVIKYFNIDFSLLIISCWFLISWRWFGTSQLLQSLWCSIHGRDYGVRTYGRDYSAGSLGGDDGAPSYVRVSCMVLVSVCIWWCWYRCVNALVNLSSTVVLLASLAAQSRLGLHTSVLPGSSTHLIVAIHL